MKNYPKARFLFDRKHESTKKNSKNPKLGLVQIEVLYERVRKFISTGVKVYLDEWNGIAPNYVVRRTDMIQQNAVLSAQMKRLQKLFLELQLNDIEFSFSMLEKANQKQETFIEFLERRIEERDIELSTKKQHRVLTEKLKEFGRIVEFSDLTKSNIIDFDDWLHRKNIMQTTVHSVHKRMKTYVNDALARGLIKENPYLGLKISRGKSAMIKYLNSAEISRFESTRLSTESLRKVRDLALFQMYTGLAYSDLARFSWKEVENKGNYYVIRDVRQKTKEEYHIILLSPALEILKKYDFSLPLISLVQYNLRLKLVADACGIEKHLTSHCLRHTFATMALNNGVPIEVVSKVLGHTNIKTTQIYAKVLASNVEQEMLRLDDRIRKNHRD